MILPLRVLGRPGAHWITSGVAIGPISLRTCLTSSLRSSSVASTPVLKRDVGVDALTLDVVRESHHRRFADRRVADQGALDFGRSHPVAGNVDHVVHSAQQPVVAVLVLAASVAREIQSFVGAEVRLDEPVVVAPRGPHDARPRLLDAQLAGRAVWHLVALVVDDDRLDAEERAAGTARLQARGRRAAG